MLNRALSANEPYVIDYRKIIELLEEALDARTNGNNVFSKETQAEIDQIQSLLDSYEAILEDIDSEGGIATRAAELDSISNEAVKLLIDLKIVADIDADDLLEPIPVAEIEGEETNDDEETEEDE